MNYPGPDFWPSKYFIKLLRAEKDQNKNDCIQGALLLLLWGSGEKISGRRVLQSTVVRGTIASKKCAGLTPLTRVLGASADRIAIAIRAVAKWTVCAGRMRRSSDRRFAVGLYTILPLPISYGMYCNTGTGWSRGNTILRNGVGDAGGMGCPNKGSVCEQKYSFLNKGLELNKYLVKAKSAVAQIQVIGPLLSLCLCAWRHRQGAEHSRLGCSVRPYVRSYVLTYSRRVTPTLHLA